MDIENDHSYTLLQMTNMNNVFIFTLIFVLGAVVNDAAPGHQRGQSECDDEDFSACNAILKRVDVIAEYCRIKDQFQSCTEQLISDKQCTVKKDSPVAATLQTLIDLNCERVAECFQKLEEVSKIMEDKFFKDNETFCRGVDTVISHGYYMINNCNASLPEYALRVAEENILQNYQRAREIRCSQTVPPLITVQTATTKSLVTTEAEPVQPVSTIIFTTTTPKVTSKTATTYPLTMVTTEASIKPSALTNGVTKMSTTTTAVTTESVTEPPPLNYNKCFEQHFFTPLAKLKDTMEIILRNANYINILSETAKAIYCRAYHSFVARTVTFAAYQCDMGHDLMVRSLLLRSAEDTLGLGCIWRNHNEPDGHWPFFFPGDDDDLFDDIDDELFDDLFDDR